MSKLLIISQDEKTRDALKGILENDYEMILTDSVEQGLEIIQNTEISKVIVEEEEEEFPDAIVIKRPIIKDEVLAVVK